MSGRLVAAMTVTLPRLSKPSMDVSSWFTTRSVTLESLAMPRRGAMASISSRNTMAGATCLAFLKIWRMAFSDSPTHLDMISGPFTLMKFTWHSLATARASSVFPVPGGPYSSTPRPGRMPRRENAPGSASGSSIISLSSRLMSSRPPTSLHSTLGISTATSAHRRRLHLPQRVPEVLLGYAHPLQHPRRHRLVQVELRDVPPQALHGRLPGQGGQVRADVPVRYVRQHVQVNVLGQGHAPGVDLHDLLAAPEGGHPDLDLPVEAAGPPQRGIDGVLAVGGSDYDDLPPAPPGRP